MKTFLAKNETVQPKWHLIDADGVVLGRLAVKAANIIRGRHKAAYTPSVDNGDFVVIINAEKIAVTGNKLTDKFYYHHTGAIGGIKSISLEKLLKEHPERVLQFAIKGMLPKGPMGRRMLKKLHVYAGGAHPHAAQQPKAVELA